MFKNLKVIELASVLAGPLVGSFFSELGASVIKIENKKTGGDVTRQWKLPTESGASTVSAYYASANWNKETIFLNLAELSDREQLNKLLATADVIIVNFKSGSAKKLGLDYESIKSTQPKIIYGEITGFGNDDPRPGYDVVLQAESGFMFMNGTPESGPIKMPVAMIDILTAHQLKEGLLLALLRREQTGSGSLVSVSLFDTAIASLANQASNWLMASHIPQRTGSLHPNIAPYGEVFQTRDKKLIVIAIGNDAQFKNLCKIFAVDNLVLDNRFIINQDRVKNRKELSRIFNPLFRKHDLKESMALLNQYQVPAGAVRNLKEVFESKEADHMVLSSQMEGMETKRVRTVAFKTRY